MKKHATHAEQARQEFNTRQTHAGMRMSIVKKMFGEEENPEPNTEPNAEPNTERHILMNAKIVFNFTTIAVLRGMATGNEKVPQYSRPKPL